MSGGIDTGYGDHFDDADKMVEAYELRDGQVTPATNDAADQPNEKH